MRKIGTVAIILALAPAIPAQAQKPADILACAIILRDTERLACYDAAVADSSVEARAASQRRAEESARIAAEEAVVAAAAAKAKAAADAVAAAKTKREAFGAEGVASRSAERFVPAAGEIVEINAAVTDMLTNRSLQNVFLLDNGQMWRQVDAVALPNIRPGDPVKVTRDALGGYKLMLVKQKRFANVKRLR
jgi:hypothetical protein